MTVQRILFICMGNICRSPSAEGVFRHLVESKELSEQFEIDSAGTGNWHAGNPPDTRAQLTAKQRGIDLSGLRARQVNVSDFDNFDLIIAMDNDNLENLRELCPPTQHHKIKLLLSFSNSYHQTEVPDPYYGGDNGFETVLDMIEDSCDQLLKSLMT